jgi:hypothetical protein
MFATDGCKLPSNASKMCQWVGLVRPQHCGPTLS